MTSSRVVLAGAFAILAFVILPSVAAQAFSQDSNGIVKCPGVEVGGNFTIGGVTYVKRDESALRSLAGSQKDWPLLSTSCTTGVKSMARLFNGVSAFNQPIGTWDTSSVTDMTAMFYGASAFNQPIGNWDTSSVINIIAMFMSATSFNQNLSGWKINPAITNTPLYCGNFLRYATAWVNTAWYPKLPARDFAPYCLQYPEGQYASEAIAPSSGLGAPTSSSGRLPVVGACLAVLAVVGW